MKLNVFKSQLPKDEMCHLRRCEHYISISWHIELSKYAKQIIILSEIDRNIIFSKRIHASEDPFYYQRRRVNSFVEIELQVPSIYKTKLRENFLQVFLQRSGH